MNKKWGNIVPDFDNDNSINGWKLQVVDVEYFRLERPSMSSFETDEIQSAINSALALLDAECNGLIQEVWFITDVESKFYRTGKEKNYIREAAIMQTQYFINLGNDYTDGSTSFNASGISASFQRPLDKKNIAPGVFILLQKGRVYELQSYDLGGNNFGKKPTANSLVNYVQFGVGDVRYVTYNQMPYNRQEGSLLYVEKGEIKFFTVEQLDLTVPRAYLLWDKATKSFEDIHDVKDIAFFGNQLDNALTRQEVYNLISAGNTIWNSKFEYQKGVKVDFLKVIGDETFIGNAVSLIDNNIGNNPADEVKPFTKWMILDEAPIDLNLLVDAVVVQMEPIIDEKFESLPTINYVSDYANQVLSFESSADFNAFKAATKTTDADYVDVPTKRILFYKGEIKMFDSVASFSDFKDAINLLDSEFNTLAPRGDSYLRISPAARGLIPRINNGIIDSDLFLKEKDLNHIHTNVDRIITGGNRLASGTNLTIANSPSPTTGADPKISIGSKNPLSIDTLLNTFEVFGIVFTKNIER